MGFFSKQFRKVIQWENDNPSTIVWRYPLDKKEEIMRKSTLVVREGQKALFIQEGKLADVFSAGSYRLDEIKNIPVLTALYNWKTAWESPYTGDVFFVSTKQFIDNKWGTSNPVIMRDQDFGMVRVRGFGKYSFAVGTPTKAMTELFGSMGMLSVKNVDDYFRGIITSVLSNVIAESEIPALDLSMHYDDLSTMAKEKLEREMGAIGIEIKGLYIENISLPEEVEKMVDKRTSVGVMSGSMNSYAQMESVGAMRDAAKNPGGLAGAGIGLGAGLGMGKMFADNMRDVTSGNGGEKCANCGAALREGAKFCPECGKAVSATEVCPKCGAKVKATAKFCPECGQALGGKAKCVKCGEAINVGAKFCPHCGERQ